MKSYCPDCGAEIYFDLLALRLECPSCKKFIFNPMKELDPDPPETDSSDDRRRRVA